MGRKHPGTGQFVEYPDRCRYTSTIGITPQSAVPRCSEPRNPFRLAPSVRHDGT